LEGVLWPAINPKNEEKYSKYLLMQGQMTNAQIAILTVAFNRAKANRLEAPDESEYGYI
jgi:hypothetical protein